VEWNMLAVRTAEDDDGRLYPLIGSAGDLVEAEAEDGVVRSLPCSGLSLGCLVAEAIVPPEIGSTTKAMAPSPGGVIQRSWDSGRVVVRRSLPRTSTLN
jgi:hypothetical protein